MRSLLLLAGATATIGVTTMNSTRFHDIFADRVAKLSTEYELKLEREKALIKAYENTVYAPKKTKCNSLNCSNIVTYILDDRDILSYNYEGISLGSITLTYLLSEIKDGNAMHSNGSVGWCYHKNILHRTCSTELAFCSKKCASHYEVHNIPKRRYIFETKYACDNHAKICCCGNVVHNYENICESEDIRCRGFICDDCLPLRTDNICSDCANTF
jgi:hypothetical protein